MTFLDNQTVILGYGISTILCLLVIVDVWRLNRQRFQGLGFWLAGYALQIAIITLVAGRGRLPDLFSELLADVLVMVSILWLYMGLERFVVQPSPQTHNYLLLAAFVGVQAYFTFGMPSRAARTTSLSLGMLALYAQCLWLVLRRVDASLRPLTRNASLVFVLYILVSAGRAVAGLVSFSRPSSFPAETLDPLMLLIYQVLVVGLTFALLLFVNARAEQEWQQAEAEARESEARFQTLVQNQGEGTGLIDAAENFVFVNPAAETIFGVPPGGLLGLNLRNFTTAEHFEHFQQSTPEHAAGLRSVDELEIKRPSGEKRQLLVTGTPNFQASGRFVGTFVVFRDITERQQAELALRESERRLRQAQAIAQVGNWEIDLAAQTLWASEEAFRIYGLERVSPFIPLAAAQQQVHPSDRPAMDDALRGLVAGGRPYNMEFQLLRAHDGARRIVQSRAELVRDAAGHPVKVAGVIQDVTERKEMEAALGEERAHLAQRVDERTAELRQANAELRRASRMKDEFLANMSHELRTPLTAILGLAESLQMGSYGRLPEKPVEILQMIRQSGQHLLALINDILDLSKIEAGKLELQLAPAAAADICQVSLQFVKQAAHKKHIQLTYRHDPLVRLLVADPRRLKQMLVNLLNNAVKFTPENGAVTLEVTGEATRREVCFTVCDNGIGIPLEKQALLFQPFVQVDGSLARQYEGAGLGLALTRRLAELHGGHVSVESAGTGQGSRFSITLPWQPAGTPFRLPPEPARSPRPFAQALGQKPVILLVDDNETTLMTLGDFLEALSARVITANSGPAALALAQAEHPDIILMDVQMPEMNGLEAIQRLRAIPETAQTPMVAITALVMEGDRERCLAAGANAYLSKPLSLPELEQTVAELLKTVPRSPG
jgi:PAS domain S-box-containing protein